MARGGADDETNWVTTSMLRNSAKAHWTLDELGWTLLPAGDSTIWDGLTTWYVDYLTRHPQYRMGHLYLRQWFAATVAVRAEFGRPVPDKVTLMSVGTDSPECAPTKSPYLWAKP